MHTHWSYLRVLSLVSTFWYPLCQRLEMVLCLQGRYYKNLEVHHCLSYFLMVSDFFLNANPLSTHVQNVHLFLAMCPFSTRWLSMREILFLYFIMSWLLQKDAPSYNRVEKLLIKIFTMLLLTWLFHCQMKRQLWLGFFFFYFTIFIPDFLTHMHN